MTESLKLRDENMKSHTHTHSGFRVCVWGGVTFVPDAGSTVHLVEEGRTKVTEVHQSDAHFLRHSVIGEDARGVQTLWWKKDISTSRTPIFFKWKTSFSSPGSWFINVPGSYLCAVGAATVETLLVSVLVTMTVMMVMSVNMLMAVNTSLRYHRLSGDEHLFLCSRALWIVAFLPGAMSQCGCACSLRGFDARRFCGLVGMPMALMIVLLVRVSLVVMVMVVVLFVAVVARELAMLHRDGPDAVEPNALQEAMQPGQRDGAVFPIPELKTK